MKIKNQKKNQFNIMNLNQKKKQSIAQLVLCKSSFINDKCITNYQKEEKGKNDLTIMYI